MIHPDIVKKSILYIEQNRELKTKDELKEDKVCSEIIEQCPKLFDMVYDNEFDYKPMFNELISSMNRIVANPSVKDKEDKQLGLRLAKEYVYPHVDLSKEIETLENNFDL